MGGVSHQRCWWDSSCGGGKAPAAGGAVAAVAVAFGAHASEALAAWVASVAPLAATETDTLRRAAAASGSAPVAGSSGPDSGTGSGTGSDSGSGCGGCGCDFFFLRASFRSALRFSSRSLRRARSQSLSVREPSLSNVATERGLDSISSADPPSPPPLTILLPSRITMVFSGTKGEGASNRSERSSRCQVSCSATKKRAKPSSPCS